MDKKRQWDYVMWVREHFPKPSLVSETNEGSFLFEYLKLRDGRGIAIDVYETLTVLIVMNDTIIEHLRSYNFYEKEQITADFEIYYAF